MALKKPINITEDEKELKIYNYRFPSKDWRWMIIPSSCGVKFPRLIPGLR